MRSMLTIAAATVAAALSFSAAQAQDAHVRGPLRLNVQPRSWLDPGNTVAPYSSVNPASAYGQTVSYLNNPPYQGIATRFSQELPDPVTNGPFIGARSPFDPVDIPAPDFLR